MLFKAKASRTRRSSAQEHTPVEGEQCSGAHPGRANEHCTLRVRRRQPCSPKKKLYHPHIPMQRVCIAIDWGTAACGYALATPSPTSTSPVNARILPFKPGDRASQATEKNLTAILLDAGTLNIVAFGREARRRFFDMDQTEQKNYAFIQQCKMALSGGTTPLHDRTVHAEGADIAVPLLTAIAKMLEFIRLEAVDRVRSIGLDVNSIAWVLTVPAIWEESGKYFMRQAAFQAGLISEVDSDKLALALEPEGAVISSAMDAPPEVRAQLKVGQRVMVLDCGGGTVDCTVSEIQSNDPPRLKEILPPSGGSWGGTYVDSEFRKFVNDVILSTSPSAATAVSTASDPETASPGGESATETTGTPSTSTSRHADATATASAMDAWESAKCGWDPTDPAHDKVIVSGLASVCEHVGGADELSARVAAYNASRGLEGSAGVVYRPRSFSLVLPPAVVKGFFDACVEPICGHLQGLLVAAAEKRKPVAFVFLVGGFAESVYLQRSVREALLTDEGTLAAALIVPAKPVQCVNRGAAVWGLYPSSFITSRVAKMTIAVSLCERYNPALHNPLPHPSYLITNSTGQWVDNVLVPLIQLNEDIPVDHVSGQEVNPVRDGQEWVNFNLYRLNSRLPAISENKPRTYVITEAVSKLVPPQLARAHVPSSSAAACLRVNVGGGASASTRASLNLMFGKTEIQAVAHSSTTGDRRNVNITWTSTQLASS